MTRPIIHNRPQVAARALELKRTGMSYAKVASALGICQTTVLHMIHDQAEQKPLDRCEACGETNGLCRHTDYQALTTTILCAKCHRAVHIVKGRANPVYYAKVHMSLRHLNALEYIKCNEEIGNSIDVIRKSVIEYAKSLGWQDPQNSNPHALKGGKR